jgi:hypothetical protein
MKLGTDPDDDDDDDDDDVDEDESNKDLLVVDDPVRSSPITDLTFPAVVIEWCGEPRDMGDGPG